MPSVASVDPFWSVTLRSLRELTRLAVAALVLAVGLGGASAAPAPASSVTGSAAVTTAGPIAANTRPTLSLPRREPVVEQVSGATAAPSTLRHETSTDTTAVPLAHQDGLARDPGRGVPARRGPPAA
ncbi:hypothetical protein V6U77_04390 [Micromonospora sp. CPCC 205546]|uniref:hypothetical protein n=1 Tax=Micromonospora sp. CPCC 205546 TaxID=3122397 RepID=UPI002FEF73C6